MKSSSKIFAIFLLIAIPSVTFAKDMAGTIVECTPKRETDLLSGDSITPAKRGSSYTIGISNSGKFCFGMGKGNGKCQNPKDYSAFVSGSDTHFDDDYYYIIDDKDGQLKIGRDGSSFYDRFPTYKIHGYCEKIRSIDW